MESFSYFSTIKFDFIAMNIFDILIGNQDRHPFNWQVLFKNGQSFFGPLYDNGASLGWQHSDVQLKEMLDNQYSLNRYFKGMKVKAGILENTQPPLRATQVLSYCITNYPSELRRVMELLKQFDVDAFYDYIDTFPLISGIRKTFLKKLINFRIEKILSICIKER